MPFSHVFYLGLGLSVSGIGQFLAFSGWNKWSIRGYE